MLDSTPTKINPTINRILYGLNHYFPISDGYTIRSQFILEYLKKYYQINVVLLKGQKLNEAIPFFKQKLRRKKFHRALRKTVEREEPQLIHANSPWEVGQPANEIAATFEIPMIYEVRGFWEETKVAQGEITADSKKYLQLKERETDVIFHADHVIAISEGIRDEIIQRGIEPEKISVIPNGIDVNKFTFIPPEEQSLRLVQKYNLENSKVIGYIGTVRHLEGLHLIIEGFSEILGTIPQLKMLVVGDGPDLQSLKTLVKQTGLENYIIFVGNVDHSLIREYYSVMNLIVLPRISSYVNEIVSPIKILEAMALGKVVLGSDVGGIKEVIQNGRNGFLFRKDDLNNFVAKCTTLLERDQLRIKITHAAREWVEMYRDWQLILSQYHSIYEKVTRLYYENNIA